ncbi:hypothetical protein EV177_003322, partial [Coemansia sp. RSA 1804]
MSLAKDTPAKMAAKGIALVAFLFMLHSGYSAREFLLYSKSIGRQDLKLPIEIVLECLGALAVMTVAIVVGVGELKPISYEAEMKRYSVDGIYSRPSFQVFNHRGRFLRPLEASDSLGDIKIDIIDDSDIVIEAFMLELSAISGTYESKHDLGLRETLIRTSNLEPTDSSK